MTVSRRLFVHLFCAGFLVAPILAQGGSAAASGVTAPLAPSRGVAELPRLLPPLPRELAAKGCSQTLRDGANLQGALDKAKGGDVLCLAPGGSYVGNFTLPARSDTGWVVVRTNVQASDVAQAGTRIRPTRSAPLAKLIAKSTDLSGSAVRAGPGARRWYLVLLEITTDSTAAQGPTALITFGGGGDAREASRLPSDLVLDRVYAHGWSHQTLRRCLALNSGATAVVDSWLDECHEKGADSQAIAGWGGTGPYLIENNTLAGAGENIMFGGSDPSTPGLTPSDIVLRRNHIVTPAEWKGRWTRKNLVETKNVRRYLIEANVLDGSWGDGQDGWAIVLKSANQGGRCTWCVTSDVIVRQNLIRNVGAGINVNGRGGDRRNIDSLSQRIEITENYIENVGVAPYNGVGRLLMLLTGTDELLIAQNTFLSPPSGSLTAAIVLGGRNQASATRLTFDRNVLTRGRYGVVGCGGPKFMLECLPGARIQGNFLVGAANPGDRQLSGFAPAGSEGGALARAGVSRATIERATAGVVVER
ncbi:MAG: hypothetical protein ABI910_22290 [Gemmatimonadota bacterium]